ncbi:MAG: hypothetical protein J07HB67_01717 [halophilic archaeon J07HB67]|nr:MAG: hypothetical protein J07HB67_01717 [halophilic archaeon J07HB67]
MAPSDSGVGGRTGGGFGSQKERVKVGVSDAEVTSVT